MSDGKPVTALRGVGERQAERLRASASIPSRISCSPAAALRGSHARRAARGASAGTAGGGGGRGIAHRSRVPRPPPDAFAHRRRVGLSDAAIFLFHRAAAGGPCARGAHPLLRRSAARAQGSGDRASRVSPRRSQIAGRRARRAPDADLSRHRRLDSGPLASAGRTRARPDFRARARGLAAARGTRRLEAAAASRGPARPFIGRRRTHRSSC